MYLVIDDWDEKILGYCMDKNVADEIAENNMYLTGHEIYVHKCEELTDTSLIPSLCVCVHHCKYGDSIVTYKNPPNDIKEACVKNEINVDNIDHTTYVYFNINTDPNESRDDLEKRIITKLFQILKEKGF